MTTFVKIVETGSLTAAADALKTSPPTVVRSLAALEQHLGVSLLKRTTRRLHLTDEGAQYLERCRLILSAVADAEGSLVSRRSEPAGKLTVTASALFGRRYIGPIVNDFVRRHPKVTADLLFVDRIVNLVEEGVDVGIRIAHLKDSSMIAIPVGRTRRVICASESYLRQHGAPRTPKELNEHRCIRHLGLGRGDWHFRVEGRQVAVPVSCAVTCNDIDTAVNACVDGLGMGMFLSYMVALNRKRGELRYVLEKFEPEPIPVQVIYAQAKLMSNTVRAFIDESVGKLRGLRFH